MASTSLNASLSASSNAHNTSLLSSSFLANDRSLLNTSGLPATTASGSRTPKNKEDGGRHAGAGGRSRDNSAGRVTSSSKSRTPRLGKSPSAAPAYDRFIPKRSGSLSNLSCAALSLKGSLEESVFQDGEASPRMVESRRSLSNALLGDQKKDRILEFRAKPPPAPEGSTNPFSSLYTHAISKTGAHNAKKIPRAIPAVPSRILDAPDLLNDYYLTRLDWGGRNMLAVALGAAVYLWNGETAAIDELFSCAVEGEQRYVSGVSWLQAGNFLAVGISNGEVQIWDANEKRRVRVLGGHSERVGCLDWNQHVLASGCKSGAVHYHDVRVKEHYFCSLRAHSQEVCGLRWSPDGRYLASGGNDNVLNIWPCPAPGKGPGLVGDTSHEHPLYAFTLHQAAVKAVAWCPWQSSVLASGGGTADRCVKVWNINMGSLICSKETGSQVSGLVWSEEYREVVTGHGYAKNELILWKYPSFERIAELTGHTDRILDVCLSSDGSTVVSSGADETIRLWHMFPVDLEKRKKAERDKIQPTGLARQCLR
ncbi:cell division cycle protein 20 homolog isoform X2 [Paramacrobiotus metropolitanus]|uniref:cell division cycle protein 20 homolog isoform X2 n=1 Tax=Paramacrobiotus metropolitanus TaxID=2943436 RepID=UPI0024458E56|nr:cell division cycle protein 20 homolog isoform X2 [Paramacrobiotus metropolitanus]